MHKIYVFIEGQWADGGVSAVALSEDGALLASHVSTHEDWAKYDMGLTSTRKHDAYKQAYPDGYELVYVTRDELESHSNAAFEVAYERAQA